MRKFIFDDTNADADYTLNARADQSSIDSCRLPNHLLTKSKKLNLLDQKHNTAYHT